MGNFRVNFESLPGIVTSYEDNLLKTKVPHKSQLPAANSNKKYPTKYFIISENAKFVYEFHVYGTESPDYIINNAQTKILESPYGCKRIIN